MVAATPLLLALLQAAASPAPAPAAVTDCSAPAHGQFDFWIGDWDVVPNGAPQTPGRKPSRNTVTKIQSGCVSHENWQAATNTGESFNIYDRTRDKWHQTWVDSGGGLQEFWGGLKDGNMVYEGTAPPPKGQTVGERTRMTFFNLAPGKVRQLVERSSDGGKTWKVQYDFAYTRKAASATASAQ